MTNFDMICISDNKFPCPPQAIYDAIMDTTLTLSTRAAYVEALEVDYGISGYEWFDLWACNKEDTEHPAWAVLQYHSQLSDRHQWVTERHQNPHNWTPERYAKEGY